MIGVGSDKKAQKKTRTTALYRWLTTIDNHLSKTIDHSTNPKFFHCSGQLSENGRAHPHEQQQQQHHYLSDAVKAEREGVLG